MSKASPVQILACPRCKGQLVLSRHEHEDRSCLFCGFRSYTPDPVIDTSDPAPGHVKHRERLEDLKEKRERRELAALDALSDANLTGLALLEKQRRRHLAKLPKAERAELVQMFRRLRQVRTWDMIQQGLSYKEIAKTTGCAESTVYLDIAVMKNRTCPRRLTTG